ncbi:uncharacterized protein HME9302_01217 [Alteripontixanthobacter maritimus]|uniref:Phosphodiester glycosidase domain-containing protein n=1 Tax=Alteripontixanthobacter maritimus TaxID=2161824 RepID=A0A369QCK8_9SPHN|nr:phosphodiester glycosidase family protein [Alteripontixanthobacter maritimus]RDC60018.1 uncharacterized protein HME9302_01217 [Alteripontixanthobacter maritimus]
MMRLLIVPLALTLVSCGDTPEGKPVMRTEIGSGVAEDIAATGAEPGQVLSDDPALTPGRPSACRTLMFEGARFTHCIADPASHRITTALGPEGGAPYRSLARLAAEREANAPPVAFAVNAGMYDDEGKPIGYFVENGNRRKELSRTEGAGNFHLMPNGVFFGTSGKWQVRTSDDFYRNVGDRPRFGTQSGPMLVIKGKLHPEISQDGPSKAIRNGVGVAKDGKAHFLISNEPVSFGKLARLYRDELKVPDALFLDGNVSSLWDPVSGRLDTGPAIGPLLVVELKE